MPHVLCREICDTDLGYIPLHLKNHLVRLT